MKGIPRESGREPAAPDHRHAHTAAVPAQFAQPPQMLVFAASASALASPIAPPGQISRVAVVGGTHGNEKIGPLLLELLDAQPGEADRPSFETLRVLANPDADTNRPLQ